MAFPKPNISWKDFNDPRLTKDENATEKRLSNYSDPQSKERVRRETYGGKPSQNELNSILGILNQKDSQYKKDYFTDFLINANQSQPVNQKGTKREYLEAMSMAGDKLVKLGSDPTPEDIKAGIVGKVKITPDELKGFDMNTHLHPNENEYPFLPSGDVTGQVGDVGFAKRLSPAMKNFIVTETGDLTNYDAIGQGSTDFEYIKLSNGNAIHEKKVDEFIDHVKNNSDIKISKNLLKNASPERLKKIFSTIKMAGL